MKKGKDCKKAEDDGLQRLYSLVIDQILAGYDKENIIDNLTKMGIEKSDAVKIVDTIVAEVLKAKKKK